MDRMPTLSFPVRIIGYGNPQCRDDGIGAYVVAKLDAMMGEMLENRGDIQTVAVHQLGPELVEELKSASSILFVDASMQPIKGGWQWTRVAPESRHLHHLLHHFNPGLLLGLLGSIYHHNPETWMVSIEGDDFDFGEGLTPEAENRACKVVAEIVKVLT